LTYFVTGATGFIGRHLVERLLDRDGVIHVLVREGSQPRLEELVDGWESRHPGARDRIRKVVGDLQHERLGVDPGWVDAHRGTIGHVFHLAAIYDMTAGEELNERMNVAGTRHAVQLTNALEAGLLHHVSSVAVAGSHRGLFREDMFDEGQSMPSPYHRTKFESERIARAESTVPWRVYRPAVVVGHSRTGEMDKVDGPYYFFQAIQKLRDLLPQWVPLIGPELGWTNIVPVDYVAAALDHIAHQAGLDGQAFHLAHPRGIRSGEVLNAFAKAAHAPQMAVRIDKKLTDACPRASSRCSCASPSCASCATRSSATSGSRARSSSTSASPRSSTPATRSGRSRDGHRRARAGLVRRRAVALLGEAPGSRPLPRPLVRRGGQRADRRHHGRVERHRRAAALKIAAAGGIPLLVARGLDKLEETEAEIEAAGGTAYAYTADLSSTDSIDELVGAPARRARRHRHARQQRRALHPALRGAVAGPLPRLRAHDAAQLLRGDQARHGPAAAHEGARLRPHRERLLHRVQASPPRFSAYVASKAALDAWTKVVSSEVVGFGVTFTTIHMPLVRTPMIAPTKLYDSFPTITPDEAGDMVCEALRSRPKSINTRLGTFAEVAYALMPKAVDQILHMAYKVFPDSTAAKGEKARTRRRRWSSSRWPTS
jgi:thioester reductase-like protein